MARITVEIDEEFLADVRTEFGLDSDEEAVRAAVVDAAKRLRRREFSDAIKSGELDLMDGTDGAPPKGSAAA